ncbi:MAG: metal ABC transporter ATP-binding protein [Clostridia bacterium]|nr:metal ABC transporter ATP-binding protein [Clostridia bacterium]
MSLISCKNVYLSYENNSVVEDLSFVVNEGDYLCVVGENGSGKSTLIKAILGLKQTADGHLHFGNEIKSGEIGYLPQQSSAQKDFPASVFEVVLSGCIGEKKGIFFSKKNKEYALENMKKLDIEHLKNKCYRELSGGQQQRVLLARALCAGKKILLLDEPVTGLDPVVTNEFYALIKKINIDFGITIVMVSHDLQACLGFATHILHLKKTNSFFGTRDEYMLSDAYMKYTGGKINA